MKIYTDGSFNVENNTPGWGFVVVDDFDTVIYQDSGIVNSAVAALMRNVAGELSAVMHAVKWASRKGYAVTICHDYIGISQWVNGSWECKKKATKAYKSFMEEHAENVAGFEHVKGHSGNVFNDMADELARKAAI